MTTNALGQGAYSITVILADVGMITDQDKTNVASAIGNSDSVVHFTTDLHELHLYWPLFADTIDDAIDETRTTLRQVIKATGAACPRTLRFDVCQIGQ